LLNSYGPTYKFTFHANQGLPAKACYHCNFYRIFNKLIATAGEAVDPGENKKGPDRQHIDDPAQRIEARRGYLTLFILFYQSALIQLKGVSRKIRHTFDGKPEALFF